MRRASTLGSVRVLKALGLAGILGVAAGGVVLARDQRARAAYTPDEVRERLHRRARGAGGPPSAGTPAEVNGTRST